jgi:cell division protein FtsB
VYFIWHIIGGERSIYTLMHTERQIVKVESRLALATQEREALEARVAKLRPGSIDPDLLEERARVMLGYSRPDEHIVILPN